MAPVELEGDTLGDRHRHFNKLVQDALKQSTTLQKLSPDDTDVDNLIKIDVASSRKDVDFILDVLRGDDMLYVSRALKNAEWLLEPHLSHIFNPEILHSELLPTMTAKAGNKLLLFIRLHLKDGARVDSFYRYYEEKNLKQAFKWLPHCSTSLAEEVVLKHQHTIDNHIIKRLCERSITFLTLYMKDNVTYYNAHEVLKATMFLLNTDTEKYLDIIESTRDVLYGPRLGPKATSLAMKKSPQRILGKFEKYINIVDTPTVAKYMKPEEIKGFLIKLAANKKIKMNFDNLKLFAKRMPKDERFQFLKKIFIDKEVPEDDSVEQCDEVSFGNCNLQQYAMSMPCRGVVMKRKMANYSSQNKSSANIYKWYRFAPFETAFLDLKKLLRNESSPAERNEILAVLLVCAARNPEHVYELLKFYQESHINEPFKFKIHFINQVLSKTYPHKYDSKTWEIMNNIFRSMEVYIKSNNDVDSCVQSIIVHQILIDEPISEIVQKKFSFSTLKSLRRKLTPEQSEKVFKYLFQYLEKQMPKDLSENAKFNDAVTVITNMRKLLTDWHKDIADYPIIQTKASELIKILSEQKLTNEFNSLFDMDSWWRRQMFEVSVAMRPNEETLLNALKHRPGLLEQHEEAIQTLRRDDNILLWRLLAKLRVYWSRSKATHWIAQYRANITAPGGQRAMARGLCALLPPRDLIPLLREYAPMNTKIDWASLDEEVELSLRKSLAQSMHHARPHPPLDVALLYASGDYLQFALPSLTSIAFSLSVNASREIVPVLLDAPVSLRKHGLRLAFAKLPAHELTPIFSRIWKSSKNPSIRAILFNHTFQLMCQEKRPEAIQEVWQMISLFIDNLSTEENKDIYATLARIHAVPVDVRAQFLTKGLKFLKTLPAKANCEDTINDLIYSTRDVMTDLDYDFVVKEVMPHVEKKLSTNMWASYVCVITAFMLSAPDEKEQDMRYKTVLIPLLEASFAEWDKKYESKHRNSDIIQSLLEHFCRDVTSYVLEKNMIIPVKMYEQIQRKIENDLKTENKYYLSRFCKLTVGFVKCLYKYNDVITATIKEQKLENKPKKRLRATADPSKLDQLLIDLVVPEFTEVCLTYLKEDLDLYFPSVCRLFSDVFERMYIELSFSEAVLHEIYKKLLREEFIPSYLLVLDCLPCYSEFYKVIRKLISMHPSQEVKMHYFKKCKDVNDDIECY